MVMKLEKITQTRRRSWLLKWLKTKVRLTQIYWQIQCMFFKAKPQLTTTWKLSPARCSPAIWLRILAKPACCREKLLKPKSLNMPIKPLAPHQNRPLADGHYSILTQIKLCRYLIQTPEVSVEAAIAKTIGDYWKRRSRRYRQDGSRRLPVIREKRCAMNTNKSKLK